MDKSITLFGDKKTPTSMPQMPPQPSIDISSLQRRLKMVEDGLSNLRRQEQLNEQNTIAINRRVGEQLKEFQDQINEMEQHVQKIKNDVHMIIAELQNCVKSEDFSLIKKYVNMINPIHFVTQQEVEALIEEKMRK